MTHHMHRLVKRQHPITCTKKKYEALQFYHLRVLAAVESLVRLLNFWDEPQMIWKRVSTVEPQLCLTKFVRSSKILIFIIC